MNRADYFWPKVVKSEGCWLWTGAVTRKGYGAFWVGRTHIGAHRFSYEEHHGPIPEGLHVDHLCHTQDEECFRGNECPHRRCVRPDHLQLVLPETNARLGRAGLVTAVRQRAKTHCPHGHPYDETNTYIDCYGWRQCRACKRQFRGQRRVKTP